MDGLEDLMAHAESVTSVKVETKEDESPPKKRRLEDEVTWILACTCHQAFPDQHHKSAIQFHIPACAQSLLDFTRSSNVTCLR